MAHDNRRFRLGMEYIQRGGSSHIINNREYWIWQGGNVPSGEGMYAINEPLPDQSKIRRINCAGFTNLFFRAAGKRIPTKGNPLLDGGVAAYAGGYWGPGYFEGYDEAFDLQKAKRWARETKSGVLLLRPYWDATLAGQGHVAILLPSGYVAQSFINMNGPDCNWNFTIEQSNVGGYYKRMVHPSNWIDYKGDEVFKVQL
jgi:hypothetical protein